MSDEVRTQVKLLPDAQPWLEEVEVRLIDLPPDEELIGPEPSAGLVANIGLLGVINRIVVAPIKDGDYPYVVIDGRRRIKAMRQLNTDDDGVVDAEVRIGAILVEVDGATPDTLTVSSHSLRKENPAAEIAAIERLVATGASEKEISRATGLPLGTLRKRMKLLALPQALRDGLSEGAIAVGVAEQAAKLTPSELSKLADHYAFHGTLTGKDVDEVKRVKVDAAVASLPADLFGPAPEEPAGSPVEQALALLDLSKVTTKTTKAELLVMIEQARELLGGTTAQDSA